MAEERYQHQGYPYHEQFFESGRLIYEINAAGYKDGEIINPSSRTDYEYDGNTLIGEVITARDEDGRVVSSISYEWSQENISQKIYIRRKFRI